MPEVIGTPFVMVPLHLISPKNGKPLPASTLLTWCWLQHHMNRSTGLCFPKVETLAKEIGVTKRAVQKALSQLETLGCLRIKHRQNRPSLYTLIYAVDEPEFIANANSDSPPAKPKVNGFRRLPQKRGEREFTVSAKKPSGVNSSSSRGEQKFAPIYKEEQEEGNKNQLSTPSIPFQPVVDLYNDIFAGKKGKHKVRSLSRGSKRLKMLKARVQEKPKLSYWQEVFEKASKIPGLLGHTSQWPKGATLDNFLRPGFVDKLLNGEFDEWTGEVSLQGSFNEQDRLSKQMEDLRWKIRDAVTKFYKARTPAKQWWPGYKETLEVELRSRDAIVLLPRCTSFARSTLEKLQLEEPIGKSISNQKNAVSIQSQDGR